MTYYHHLPLYGVSWFCVDMLYFSLTKCVYVFIGLSAGDLRASLQSDVDSFRRQTFAPATHRAYQSHRRAYLAFCTAIGCPPVPATSDTLCFYAAFLARSLKFSSVRQYLNIVRILHLEWGVSNPLENNFQLACVLQGIRRDHGDQVCRKLPITPDLLRSILASLNPAQVVDAQVWAACLLMFYGLLRRSNVLTPSMAAFDASKHLRRSDITFTATGLSLVIRWTKTIQFKERRLYIPLPRRQGHPLCPVQAVFHALCLTQGAAPDGPALMIPSSRGPIPLSPQLFVGKVRQGLQAAGVDSAQYAGHSFRRGGATWAYKCGVNVESIRQLGDWKSTAYQDYIFQDGQMLLTATKRMQVSMP